MGLRRLRLLPPVLAALLLAAWAGVPGLRAAEGWTAAGASSTTTTLPPKGTVELLNGGTATVGVPAIPTEFNPATPSGDNSVTQMVMEQVWPQPFVVNSSLQPVASTPTTAPTLLISAEDVSVSPQTIVYTIDPGARWSDGVPITAAENLEDTFVLPASFVRRNGAFMLRVKGDSMIDAAILDGDLIVVEPQPTAQNGEIVVAMIDGEATVKRFYREAGRIRLQPENRAMEPIYVDDVTVVGRVEAVVRRL